MHAHNILAILLMVKLLSGRVCRLVPIPQGAVMGR